TVGAVQAGAGGLATDPEARQGGASALVHLDTAHMEMGGRSDRDQARNRVDAGVVAISGYGGKAGENGFAQSGAGIEEDPAAGLNLAEIGAGHDVARGQFGVGMDG